MAGGLFVKTGPARARGLFKTLAGPNFLYSARPGPGPARPGSTLIGEAKFSYLRGLNKSLNKGLK